MPSVRLSWATGRSNHVPLNFHVDHDRPCVVPLGNQVLADAAEFDWDAAGSMTGRSVPDGQGGVVTQSLTWDAEGELASVGQDGNADGDVVDAGDAIAGGQYVYTADGERLVRTQGSGTGRAVTVYLPGRQEVTVSASGQVSAVRYYFAGKTIAMRTGMLLDETIEAADYLGLPLEGIAASCPFCPDCLGALISRDATITSPRTAIWK